MDHVVEETQRVVNLWAAVIERAIDDLKKGDREPFKNDYESAVFFFTSEESGLADICEAINLDVSAVREKVSNRFNLLK